MLGQVDQVRGRGGRITKSEPEALALGHIKRQRACAGRAPFVKPECGNIALWKTAGLIERDWPDRAASDRDTTAMHLRGRQCIELAVALKDKGAILISAGLAADTKLGVTGYKNGRMCF